MKNTRRGSRLGITVDPETLTYVPVSRAIWYETEEEIEAGLAWARRKAVLFRWLRRQMGERLTLRERQCVELRFFSGLSLEDVAKEAGMSLSGASRAVRRSLRKLRQAAQEDDSWRMPLRHRRDRQ